MLVIKGAVDQQAFGGAADSGAAGLGVHHDPARLFDIRRLVDVDVTNAFEVRKHRHPRLRLHPAHKTLAAARHDHVDIIRRCQHGADKGAVAGRRDLDGVFGKARGAQPFHKAFMDGGSRVEALRPAPQDHRIAGLQAQPARVGCNVRAAFVDHANDAQRRADAADMEAGGHVPFRHHLTHRVVLRSYGAQAIRHALNAILGQQQAVEHGGRETLVAPEFHIARVGVGYGAAARPDGVRRRFKRRALLVSCRIAKLLRRRLRPRADIGHKGRRVDHIAVHRLSPVRRPGLDPGPRSIRRALASARPQLKAGVASRSVP